MLRLFGLTPDEAVGRNCIDLVHPDDLVRALDNLSYGTTAKRIEVPVRFRLRGAGGEWEVFGGDEFALVAVGRDAAALTAAVRASVREPIASEVTGPLRVTASVGAVDAVPSDSTGALLEVVDARCNRDKQLRRARR